MIEVEILPVALFAGTPADLSVVMTNRGPGVIANLVLKLALPAHMVLLRGSARIEISQLRAKESSIHALRIRADEPGRWTITSPNFSYRDDTGRPQRVTSFAAALDVAPAPTVGDEQEPVLDISLEERRLTQTEWATLGGTVRNVGRSAAREVAVRVVGPVHSAGKSGWSDLGALSAGGSTSFALHVCPTQRGAVPAEVEVVAANAAGKVTRTKKTFLVQVDRETTAHRYASTGRTILFLSANPLDSVRLRVDAELRDIQASLSRGLLRHRFDLKYVPAVRVEDIFQALQDFRPHIVHFSGHGTPTGELHVEDAEGRAALVRPGDVAELFAQRRESIQCVILNACYSAPLAGEIASHIEFVVGIHEAITDEGAIYYSTCFYGALAGDESIPQAHNSARLALKMRAIVPEHLLPVLVQRAVKG